MKSMTGFGTDTAKLGDSTVSVDVYSVNKKGLELAVFLPRKWQAMERLAAAEIKNFLTRGKVVLRISENSAAIGGMADAESIKKAVQKLGEICRSCGIPFAPDARLVFEMAKSMETCAEYSDADLERDWETVKGAVLGALSKMEAMRSFEGDSLARDMKSRLGNISSLVDSIDSLKSGTVENYKNQLLQKLSSMGLDIDVNDERVLKEVCIFADKCDISEEIIRLKSHIRQFLAAIDSVEPTGRKMDFICQEMGRESNTIGSKANNLEISKKVIEIKNELERVREQVQNVE